MMILCFPSEALEHLWLIHYEARGSRSLILLYLFVLCLCCVCVCVFSLCGIIPGLSSVLLPRMNPFVLINMAGALSLCITYMLIEIK